MALSDNQKRAPKIILFSISGLSVLSTLFGGLNFVNVYSNIIEPIPVLIWSGVVGFMLTLLAWQITDVKDRSFFTRSLLRNSPFFGGVAFSIWMFLSLGFFAYIVLSCANKYFDASPGISQNQTIMNKNHIYHRRSADEFVIWVDIRRQNGSYAQFSLPESTYDTFFTREHVTLNVHPGAFGFGWVDHITKAP